MASAAPIQGKRADARRNAERIVRAAVTCLAADPGASTATIAKAAGVGRVTLYAHFETRAALVEAALDAVLAAGETAIADVEQSGDAATALAAVIRASWREVAQTGALLQAAQAALPPERITDLHHQHRARATALIERGRSEGAFRTDQPTAWQVSVLEHLLHGASADVAQGRIAADAAGELVAATALAALRFQAP